MVGHHLEEVVGLGADLRGDVHLHLVDVVLQLLLHQPSPALHLLGFFGLQLKWIGAIRLAQGFIEKGKHVVERCWV